MAACLSADTASILAARHNGAHCTRKTTQMNAHICQPTFEALEGRRLLSATGDTVLGPDPTPDDYYGRSVYRQHAEADANGNMLYVREDDASPRIYAQWFLRAGDGW